MESLTALERRVMEMLLAGPDNVLAGLRDQLGTCIGVCREMTGVGFFITFRVPAATAKVADEKSFKIADVNASISGLERGAGFLLYIKDGALDMLEGYTYGEPWPKEVAAFEVSYHEGVRNWEEVRRIWS